MKSGFDKDGHSARQRVIDKIRKFISRAKALCFFLVLPLLLLSSCHEKTNGQDSGKGKSKQTAIAEDSAARPKVSIKVNRHYDDKGNIVGFDSTYSSYYSNIKGDTSRMDSLMNSFDRFFNQKHSLLFDRQFNNLFSRDSMLPRYPDFFHDDFFMKRYELNDQYLRGMMHRMDSIKNQFYEESSRNKRNSKDL